MEKRLKLQQRPLTLTLVLFAGLVTSSLCSCDSRPSPGSEPDGFAALESGGRPHQKPPTEAGVRDGCVRWKGFCTSSEDCPDGFTCEGCRGNPCCPECDVCAGTCTPIPILPDACNQNSDCDVDPGGSSFCNLDNICLSSWAVEGRCQARPTPSDCPDYDTCPLICGCDGIAYCDVVDHKSSPPLGLRVYPSTEIPISRHNGGYLHILP